MKHLSEDSLKRIGVRFLKNHYKYRPRTGKTLTSLDQKSDEGIISDGMYSFVNEDGVPFLATLEATSYDSRKEVLYSRQDKLLAWDSIVFASLISVLFFTLSHYYEWITVNKDGWLIILTSLLAIFMGAYWIFYSLIGGVQRYRYIYAIEQFKKYHADEQWIVIADDVFDNALDKYLKELKTQCVRNGFGLISIDPEEEARILITPSRQEVFGKSRTNKNFQNRDEYLKKSKTERVKSGWYKMLNRLTSTNKKGALLRYQRTYTSQIFLCLIAATILGGIFYKEAITAPISYVNEKEYEAKLSLEAKTAQPETTEFEVDSALVERDERNVKPYLEVSNDNEEADVEDDWDEEIAKYFDDYGEAYAEIYISSGAGKFVSYDCERFFNYTGTKYLIQEGTYESIRAARKQLIRLKKIGINAHGLWTGCVDEQNIEFIIFIDFLFDDKREAGTILNNMKRRFKLEKGYLKIRSITL